MAEMWSWLYTDELGTRRVYPSKLSVEDAKRLKDATPIEGTLEVSHEVGSISDARAGNGAAVDNVADLLTAINRAMFIVSCLRQLSKNTEPGIATLLAERSNELAGARMHLARLRARLLGSEQKPNQPLP
jgi:hypothetical protein